MLTLDMALPLPSWRSSGSKVFVNSCYLLSEPTVAYTPACYSFGSSASVLCFGSESLLILSEKIAHEVQEATVATVGCEKPVPASLSYESQA